MLKIDGPMRNNCKMVGFLGGSIYIHRFFLFYIYVHVNSTRIHIHTRVYIG